MKNLYEYTLEAKEFPHQEIMIKKLSIVIEGTSKKDAEETINQVFEMNASVGLQYYHPPKIRIVNG